MVYSYSLHLNESKTTKCFTFIIIVIVVVVDQQMAYQESYTKKHIFLEYDMEWFVFFVKCVFVNT